MHCLIFRASSNQLLPQTDVEASDLLPVELANQIVEVNVVFAFSLVVGANIKLSPDQLALLGESVNNCLFLVHHHALNFVIPIISHCFSRVHLDDSSIVNLGEGSSLIFVLI